MLWFQTDPHFFHKNILTFTDSETGTLIRPGFANIEEMNNLILTNHNKRVSEEDKVYWLGDVTFRVTPEFIAFFRQFKGKHRLVPGNHDNIIDLCKSGLFKKVQIWRTFREEGIIPFTCSHIPLDLSSVKGIFNVHGHIHQNDPPTLNHINICPEITDYEPRSMDELQIIMRDRIDVLGVKFEGFDPGDRVQ